MAFALKQVDCGYDIMVYNKCPATCKTFLVALAGATPECAVAVDLGGTSKSFSKWEKKMFKLCTGV